MKSAYDLHIHSCLSPCASNDMMPSNIAGMAHLKGLSIISLTDHNTGKNLKAMSDAAKSYDLIFVPGIEVTSKEEVHILVYFPDLPTAIEFADKIFSSLPIIRNKPNIFGDQIVMDSKDRPTGIIDKLLLQATPYSVDQITKMAENIGGCAVPAHINRDSYSIISNLGFIPPNMFRCVEIAESLPCPKIDSSLKKLYSSDAHYLGNINEQKHFFHDITSPKDLISFIR